VQSDVSTARQRSPTLHHRHQSPLCVRALGQLPCWRWAAGAVTCQSLVSVCVCVRLRACTEVCLPVRRWVRACCEVAGGREHLCGGVDRGDERVTHGADTQETDQWKCLFGEFRAPTMGARFLVSASQYDSFQLYSNIGEPPPYTGVKHDYAELMRARTLQAMRAVNGTGTLLVVARMRAGGVVFVRRLFGRMAGVLLLLLALAVPCRHLLLRGVWRACDGSGSMRVCCCAWSCGLASTPVPKTAVSLADRQCTAALPAPESMPPTPHTPRTCLLLLPPPPAHSSPPPCYPAAATFSPACYGHCLTEGNLFWTREVVSDTSPNVSLADVLFSFVQAHSSPPEQVCAWVGACVRACVWWLEMCLGVHV
jgi:hypothetical protein